MKIAVVNEASQKLKNKFVVAAIESKGYEVINAGMTGAEGEPVLGYMETGLIAALLLNAGTVDYVVAGCGTGQGFLNSVMQYPNVFCGLINDPLDAWLFRQINGGNCLSLSLAKGHGWASEQNLVWIIEKFFEAPDGGGYPEERKIPQAELRVKLGELSDAVKRPMTEIIGLIPEDVLRGATEFPGVMDFIKEGPKGDELISAINERLQK